MTFASPGRVQFTGLATAMSVLTPSPGLVCSSNLSDVTVALQEVYRMALRLRENGLLHVRSRRSF
jgi:hypothetical protein